MQSPCGRKEIGMFDKLKELLTLYMLMPSSQRTLGIHREINLSCIYYSLQRRNE